MLMLGRKNFKKADAFTLVELLIVITVIGIMATISVVSYNGLQKRSSQTAMISDLSNASTEMERLYIASNNSYPTTIPSSITTSSPNIKLTLHTNDGFIHYSNLTVDQNASLFVNVCSSLMPLKSPDQSVTYATSCIGQWGMNVSGGTHDSYLSTPIPDNFNISTCLSCTDSYYVPYNSMATALSTKIHDLFIKEGGTFPITMKLPWNTLSALPDPDTTTINYYCIEASNSQYSDLNWRIVSNKTKPENEGCPA
jgi:prepilin-type N-terminal cleavage/methylation domain-containing protein